MPTAKRVIPPPPRTAVANVREARYDITEYVVHMTTYDGLLLEIIEAGAIKASFSNMANVFSNTAKPTIRGPRPAVCFTEQPLWAIIDTMNTCGGRWSGYGIAFHKVPLFAKGGRPVWYVPESVLGSEVREGHRRYRKNRRIHDGAIPPDLQYLCMPFRPDYSYSYAQPRDFSWEREWRYVSHTNSLSLAFSTVSPPIVIVPYDEDKPKLHTEIDRLAKAGKPWAKQLKKIISLETVARKIEETNDRKWGRVETYPFVMVAKKKPPTPKKK
jgi:hypothetical protein